MDLQEVISNKIAADRAHRMKTSPQMTLGELIARVEPLAARDQGKKDDDKATVDFDFGSALPTGLSSWRGSYAELAINYSFNGYGYMVGYTKNAGSTFDPKAPTAEQFLVMLKEAVGKSYTGWKGGDFVMGKTTPLWVSNDGDGDHTAVIGVLDKEYRIIIETAYCDY